MSVPSASAPVPTLRVIPELRQAHLDLLSGGTPSRVLFFRENGALEVAGRPVRRVGLVTMLIACWQADEVVLELPEPLWVRALPATIAATAAWKVSGLLRRRPRRAVTYAIENNSLARLLTGRPSAPTIAVRAFGVAVGLYVRLGIDRIAYGSSGAEAVYSSLPGVAAIRSRMFEALPAAGGTARPVDEPLVAFVGALEPRKGIDVLVAAWPAVEEAVPRAHLIVMGEGDDAAKRDVSAWAAQRSASRTALGPIPRAEVKGILSGVRVLAAPSRLAGRWREQIGLPITEALAAGATVVTSEHTGLASWLRSHGHTVLTDDADVSLDSGTLAAALIAGLRLPLDRAHVQRSLPARDGRLVADEWLHSDDDGAPVCRPDRSGRR